MKRLQVLALGMLFFIGHTLAGEITIGQVTPLSGPLAPTGKGLQAGAQLYFESVNAAGGINGSKIRLLSVDDGYKTSETVRLVQELARDQKPLAFLGSVGTGNIEALINEGVLGKIAIPLVGARSGASSITQSREPWLFLTRASYEQEISRMIDLYVPLGYRKVAALFQNDAFGQDGLKSLEQSMKKHGAELVARAGYEKNTTKVEAAVKSISEAAPQLVIMISNTAASTEFVRQFRATGVPAQLVTLSVTDGTQLFEKAGASLAHGVAISQVVPDPNDTSVALSREIQERLRRFPQRDLPVNHTFAEGYLAAKILVEGLRRAGNDPSPKKLRDALEEIRNWDAGGLSISFSADNHAGSRYSDVTILNRNGKLLR